MKPRVYLGILLLIIPFQASLLNPFSLAGIKPDAGLALLYAIGLLTGPIEAALAGMAVGLVQDIGSAGIVGFAAFTRGLVGLFAGLLGQRVLDVSSPSNIIFLALFSIAEAVFIALFMEIFYGSVPFWSMLFTRMLPQAVYTGLLGYLILRLISGKKTIALLKRRPLQKEL